MQRFLGNAAAVPADPGHCTHRSCRCQQDETRRVATAALEEDLGTFVRCRNSCRCRTAMVRYGIDAIGCPFFLTILSEG